MTRPGLPARIGAGLREARLPAMLLLAAALVGIVVANSPVGAAVIGFFGAHVGVGPVDLSLGHWVSDGLLAVFFFVVSVELQYELTRGQLSSLRRAMQPAIAAAGGVLVPIAVYLAVTTGTGLTAGWPVPTATDIAFALGVLAVFGRGLPSGLRVFLLALAILDDIVGIVFIALLYSTDLNPIMLLFAAVCVVVFGALSRAYDSRLRWGIVAVMIALGVATWVFMLLSGVHATIAGVVLGLAMAQNPAMAVRAKLEPTVNGLVLPLFAFTAALVPIPAVGSGLSPAFWGIALALPVGKIIGITAAGWIAQRVTRVPREHRLPLGDLLAAGALGGIGFTVSLLLANLAFADEPAVRDQAVLGVLAGSLAALALSAVIVTVRARHYRRRAAMSATENPRGAL